MRIHPSRLLLFAGVALVAASCGPQPTPDSTRGFLNAAIVCARECPMYPALAPDSSVLVTRDEMEVAGTEEDCPRPAEWVVRSFDVAGDAPFVMEPDLAQSAQGSMEGFEALTCVDADPGQTLSLQDGFALRADLVDHNWLVELSDAAGQVLAREEWSDHGVAFCPSSTQRTVVVMFRESIPGDCAGAAPPTYGVVRY